MVSENIQDEETKEMLKKINIWEEDETMQVVEMLRKEMNRDRARARKLGIKEGKKLATDNFIKNMKNNNFSIETISLISGLEEDEVNEILKKEK